MTSDLAAVFVHYHSTDELGRSLAALGTDLRRSGLCAEWIVVDNGSDERERAALAAFPVRLVRPERNLGYAGGVNLGVAATSAPRIVVMNPDVVVEPGCVAALVRELDSGAAVAGPRFFWDGARRLVLPPTEQRTLGAECRRRLAAFTESWRRWAVARWRSHARQHWLAREPIASVSLSGALLAIRRDAWQVVGPMDEGYRLYFEECDWLARAQRVGMRPVYVPSAEAVHDYGTSTRREPAAAAWFEASRRRFERRQYGAFGVALLGALERVVAARLGSARAMDLGTTPVTIPAQAQREELWLELSPLSLGCPAAAERLQGEAIAAWRAPREALAQAEASGLFATAVTDRGEELGRWRVGW